MNKVVILSALLSGILLAEKTTVFVGTGADGIYSLKLDENTGSLEDRKLAAMGRGMSFQELSADGKILFSTAKVDDSGGVASFKVTGNELEKISGVTYPGKGLCHVSLDAGQKVLFGADYGGGSVVSFSVNEIGSIEKQVSFFKHSGSSVHPGRQKAPHAHSIYAGPDNRFAYAPDLGIDQVVCYSFSKSAKMEKKGGFKVPPGSGPRHMKFGKAGRRAYVLNELTLTITIFDRHAADGKLTAVKTIPVLPADADMSKMTCSEIRVSSDGKFIYTANRDLTDRKRDSISVLKVTADGLDWIQSTPAEVWIPRNINLSPSGDWLLVAGQKSNEVTSHRIDRKTGKLTFSGHRAEVPKAMCINFVK